MYANEHLIAMKKLLISTIVVGLSVLGANAQRINDPTYSSHNYKHPNKAEKMKRIEQSKPVVYLEEVNAAEKNDENSLVASANYKGMQPSESRIKIFRETYAPEAAPFLVSNTASGNYKQQFVPREKNFVPVQTQKTVDIVASK